MPLVFWDEFDTALGGRELGWMASFLAPMQDGQFNEGGTVRPIGPAVFVFAGGTHSSEDKGFPVTVGPDLRQTSTHRGQRGDVLVKRLSPTR